MKAYALYHPESEFYRSVEEFAHDFERTRGIKVELLSLETKEGADMARLYGVMQYPAILAVRNDGQLMKIWEGPIMPLMDEVSAYTSGG